MKTPRKLSINVYKLLLYIVWFLTGKREKIIASLSVKYAPYFALVMQYYSEPNRYTTVANSQLLN